jgi:2-keto-3-deoxy-L-fuconate dehydrogenase
MFSLKDKTTLVTGAASGIGREIARAFARAGAFVYVVDIDEPGGRETVASIRGDGEAAGWLRADVSREDECRAAAEAVRVARGRLDVLVNNAGIGHVGTTLTTSGADLDRLYAVNVRGAFNMMKVFLPGMVERRSGAIINIASIAGTVGVRDRAAYTTTKFALVGLTKAAALDHARDGVRINCICPGRVETPFVHARLREYADPAAARREMESSQPIGRMGRPEEIAAAALYLGSDEAAFVTGSALMIDGGWSAG